MLELNKFMNECTSIMLCFYVEKKYGRPPTTVTRHLSHASRSMFLSTFFPMLADLN